MLMDTSEKLKSFPLPMHTLIKCGGHRIFPLDLSDSSHTHSGSYSNINQKADDRMVYWTDIGIDL